MAYLTIFKCFIYGTYKLNISLKTLVRAEKRVETETETALVDRGTMISTQFPSHRKQSRPDRRRSILYIGCGDRKAYRNKTYITLSH